MGIKPFYHHCVDPETGNKYEHRITWGDIYFGGQCTLCGCDYPHNEILAHIYEELTGDFEDD